MAIVDKINALAGSGSGMTIEEALDNLKRNPGSGSGSGGSSDGTVVYEMAYFSENEGQTDGYRSVRNASDIVSDFALGKRVLLHLNPPEEGSQSTVDVNAYVSVIGVYLGTTNNPEPSILIAGYTNIYNINANTSPVSHLDHVSIDANGKLVVEYSWN